MVRAGGPHFNVLCCRIENKWEPNGKPTEPKRKKGGAVENKGAPSRRMKGAIENNRTPKGNKEN